MKPNLCLKLTNNSWQSLQRNWLVPLVACGLLLTACSKTSQSSNTHSFISASIDSGGTSGEMSTTEATSTYEGSTASFELTSEAGLTSGNYETENDSSTSEVEPATLMFLQIEPGNQLIELDHGQSIQMNYVAKGYYSDGNVKDVSAEAVWTINNAELGTFVDSVLHIPGFPQTEAQVGHISASVEGISHETAVIVVSHRMTGDKKDFLFVLPYTDEEGPQHQSLDFNTDIKSIDLFLNMDVTGSMIGKITNLQQGLLTEVLPAIHKRIPNVQTGVGAFADFPHPKKQVYGEIDCYGSPDQPFKLFQAITADNLLVHNALLALTVEFTTIGCGGDVPESQAEALYQIATGKGIVNGPFGAFVAPHVGTGIGGVEFRQGVMPVIVTVSDAPTHEPGNKYVDEIALVAHSKTETISALNNICARVVGIASAVEAIPDMRDFANATHSKIPPTAWGSNSERPPECSENQCCVGINGKGEDPDKDGLCSLVYSVSYSGEGVSQSVATGIDMLTRFAAFDVETSIEGQKVGLGNEVLPDGTLTDDFIKKISPKAFIKPPAPPELPDPVISVDSFDNVTPGTKVQFDVVAYNDFVKPTTEPQLFEASIHLSAEGCTDLDTRSVIIFVPPEGITIE